MITTLYNNFFTLIAELAYALRKEFEQDQVVIPRVAHVPRTARLAVVVPSIKVSIVVTRNIDNELVIEQALSWNENIPMAKLKNGRWTFAGNEARRIFDQVCRLAGADLRASIDHTTHCMWHNGDRRRKRIHN